MKKFTIISLLSVICAITFAQSIEGTWKTTIDTDNGPYTFYAEYKVDGETLTGRLYSVDGSVNIYNCKINGNEFEYNFDLNYYQIKHEGKLTDGVLKMKSVADERESEFTMTRVEKE